MDKQTEQLLKTGLFIGAGYLLVVRPLLTQLGVDPADQQTVNDQINTDAVNNPFNPNFQPFVDNWKEFQPAGLTIPDGVAQVKQMYDDGTLDKSTQSYKTANSGEIILKALSVWNWTADVNAVFSVFQQMALQVECASLAAYLSYNYNKDLLTFLHYGGSAIPFIPNGLSESQVAIIVKEVNNLPVS